MSVRRSPAAVLAVADALLLGGGGDDPDEPQAPKSAL